MNKKKDIQQLLDRFMAGLTSLEEEQQLADYFHSDNTPSEWNDYKEMFDYFDEGMPAGRYEGQKANRKGRNRLIIAITSAAAVVAVLFVATWKGMDSTSPQAQKSLPVATLTTDSVLNTVADTIPADTFNTIPTKHKKHHSLRNEYRMMMSPSHYAAVESDEKVNIDDSIARDELLLTMKLKNAERMEQLILRQIELTEKAHNMEIALAMESEDEEMDDVY